MLYAVIAFWSVVITAIVRYFTPDSVPHSLKLGFYEFWYEVRTRGAGDLPTDYQDPLRDGEWVDRGQMLGFASLILLVLGVLALAGYTIYLAA